MRTTMIQATNSQIEKLVIGKLYRFDGRIGRVIAKSPSSGKNAAGWAMGLPVVEVAWKR